MMTPERLPPHSPSPTANEEKRLKSLARGRLERAFQLRVDGDNSGARQALAEAVRIDPTLITNSTAVSLAEVLTNQTHDSAILSLLEDSQTAPVVSSPSFNMSRQGYMLTAASILFLFSCLTFSAVFYLQIAPVASQLLARAGIQAVNAVRVDATFRPMVNAPLWPIFNTGIVFTVVILINIVGSYLIDYWLGGAGSVSHYMTWLLLIYTAMMFVMAYALIVIHASGTVPPPAMGFDTTFTLGVWLLEVSLPVTLIINSLIGSRIHKIKWIRSGAAIMICVVLTTILFGILAGFTLIPKL